jgi:hypothetical protein
MMNALQVIVNQLKVLSKLIDAEIERLERAIEHVEDDE